MISLLVVICAGSFTHNALSIPSLSVYFNLYAITTDAVCGNDDVCVPLAVYVSVM